MRLLNPKNISAMCLTLACALGSSSSLAAEQQYQLPVSKSAVLECTDATSLSLRAFEWASQPYYTSRIATAECSKFAPGRISNVAVPAGSAMLTVTKGNSYKFLCSGTSISITPISAKKSIITCVGTGTSSGGGTPTPIPTPTPAPTPAPTPTPTPAPAPTPGAGNSTGNSVAFGIWTPGPSDTCTKEIHDKYFVIGPDGKKYPTWHPPVDPATGCTFGHEHGRDPKLSKLWPVIQQQYAYDANKNGVIDPAELAVSGLPFGYANEQLALTGNRHRHEDHVGHKVEWENNLDLIIEKVVNAGIQGLPSGPVGVKCDYLSKVHQGTHSPDAFTNNIHEVFYFAKCSDGHDIRLSTLAKFGASGEFNGGMPCENETEGRGTIVKVDSTKITNGVPAGAFPGQTNNGTREILSHVCSQNKILVPNGQFSGNPYEIWQTNITIPNKVMLDTQFAVFNPVREYDVRKTNLIGRTIDLCYEVESNGDRARGGTCGWLTDTYGFANKIAWDDARSPFKGSLREVYFKPGVITNAGAPATFYTDAYGQNVSNQYFVGAVKQFAASMRSDHGPQFGGYVVPDARGKDRDYSEFGGAKGVHAPN